jgi:elongation factor P
MVSASQLRAGMAVRIEGQLYKVLSAEYHPGQGRMGGVSHTRLKNLSTGTQWEHSFRAELRFEQVETVRVAMEFLFSDAGQATFMDPGTFEQITVAASLLGPQAALLAPAMLVTVEFVDGNPVEVLFPDILEVRVAATAPAVHQQIDSVWKPARLDNGAEVMVPQFIKAGDTIRLDVLNMKYMDRSKGAARG